MTKKTTKSPKKSASRWSLGVFRNEQGRLATVYVRADGRPSPYLRKQVGGRKILFHATYSKMKYSEARHRLLKDSGLKDHVVLPNKVRTPNRAKAA